MEGEGRKKKNGEEERREYGGKKMEGERESRWK